MIIIKIQGGLGNQLFQYAIGRLLEIKYAKTVAYDTNFYALHNGYTQRLFLLDRFQVRMRIATTEEIKRVKYPFGFFSKGIVLVKKVLNKFIFKNYQVVYDNTFLPSLEKKDSAYLEGFWQSCDYTNQVIVLLRQELVLQEPVRQELEEYIQKVTSRNSVFVHIRRGDYVQGGKDLQTLDVEYYKKAVELIESKVENPVYYIFSDDITWVENSMAFLFNEVIYLKEGVLKDYEELVLMSFCKHGIIANSSFSWWGAMLSGEKKRTIICPKDWKNVHFKKDTHICPKEWIEI